MEKYKEFMKIQMFLLTMESMAKEEIVNTGSLNPSAYMLTDETEGDQEKVCATSVPDIFGEESDEARMVATKMVFKMLRAKIVQEDGYTPLAGVLMYTMENDGEQYLRLVYDYDGKNTQVTHKIVFAPTIGEDGTLNTEVKFVEMD